MTATKPTTTRSQRKRSAILTAATETFRLHGFAGATMDEVARLAEVSKRTVYNHFPSKDELFVAVIEGIFDDGRRPPLAYDPDEDLAEQLQRFASAKMAVELTPDFLGLFRAIVGDFARSPELLARVVPRMLFKEAELLTWLMAARTDGRLDIPSPPRATLQFYALLKGTLFYPVLIGLRAFPSDEERNEEVRECIAMFLSRYATSKR